MLKRSWLLGSGVLLFIGLLVACSSNYNTSSDGLVLVGSQGSAVIESFGFNLNNGHVSAIANSPNDTADETCVLNGLPTSLVMDPAGAYAYAIVTSVDVCSGSKTGIVAFKVGSDGSLTSAGSFVSLGGTPSMMTMDSSGKFLFVANHTDSVSVFTASSGNVSAVAGSPFSVVQSNTVQSPMPVDIVSVATSPTVFPNLGLVGVQYAVCQVPGTTPPTGEYLYAVDTLGYQVFEFAVNTSTGALSVPKPHTTNPVIPTGTVPVGVSVDPCDRFVFVSNSLSNSVSAYTLCSLVLQPSCPYADGSLVPVTGSPFSLTGSVNGPGPIQVDPYGNWVYVVGTLSNTVSPVKIAQATGSLTPGNPIATGLEPTSMAIRSDDSWMFITNFNAATVSQYSITPATGVLSAQAPIQVDNYPFGVAVK